MPQIYRVALDKRHMSFVKETYNKDHDVYLS